MPKIVACNWKMYLDKSQSEELAKSIIYKKLHASCEFIIAPSMLMISDIARITNDTGLYIAAQDCSKHKIGAFTGQVDTKILRDFGCTYVIVGHSEVRAEYNQTEMECATKANMILNDGMIPIICVGEPLDVYQKGDTMQYLDMQLSEYSKDVIEHAIIAYEPIWAIGSGLVPSNKEISAVTSFIKSKFAANKVLYGGSVSSSNIESLAEIPEVDGFLIGGASTKISELEKIVSAI